MKNYTQLQHKTIADLWEHGIHGKSEHITTMDETDNLTDEQKIDPLLQQNWEKEVHQKNEIKDLPKTYTWKREDGDHLIDERAFDEMRGDLSLIRERESVFDWAKYNSYNRRTSMKYHDITIHKKNGGFVVNVGCETFVFETEKKMFEAISLYFKEPKKAEAKYVEHYEGE